jgi:hypothetical protein
VACSPVIAIDAKMSGAEEPSKACSPGRGCSCSPPGNVELITPGGIAIRTIYDLSPSKLGLAWRPRRRPAGATRATRYEVPQSTTSQRTLDRARK